MAIQQPSGEVSTHTFDVLDLTAQEEAHLHSLTARALGDGSREGSLASYWSETLPRITSREFRDVSGVYPYATGKAPPTECAPTPRQAAGNASYCPLDETMAYDEEFIQSLYATYGDVTPLAVLAHEWGHHVQTLAGFPTLDKAAELQADCYAGMYLRHLDDIGLLEAGDTSESLAFFHDIGDDQLDPGWNPEWYDAGVHGNSYERSQAQGVGYATGDPEYCLAYEDWADRPVTQLGSGISLRRPPGTSVRVVPDDMHEFEMPTAKVSAWTTSIPRSSTMQNALEDQLELRLGGSGALEIDSVAPGQLALNDWASGDGLRAAFRWTTADGTAHAGSAEIQVHPDRSAQVFAAFPHGGPSGQAQAASSAALDALLWGYCDPQARSPVNCAARPRVSDPPAVATPRATPRPAPKPRVTKSKVQRWQDQLMATVRNYRDCTRWTKRLETRWNGTPNAYTKGAVAAVACGTPDTIRPTSGIRQLALFRFRDAASLDDYWRYKLAKIGKSLRQTSDACTGGKQGLRSWSGAAGSGTIACYLDAGRAKLRWTNERNNTYGIVDATHKNIRRLAEWWRSADI